jgi:hypothetical protein
MLHAAIATGFCFAMVLQGAPKAQDSAPWTFGRGRLAALVERVLVVACRRNGFDGWRGNVSEGNFAFGGVAGVDFEVDVHERLQVIAYHHDGNGG